jgi:hypothetical protein
MNEWPELENGEGVTNDRFWVSLAAEQGGCSRPIVLKNSRDPDSEPSSRNYLL